MSSGLLSKMAKQRTLILLVFLFDELFDNIHELELRKLIDIEAENSQMLAQV